MCKNVTFKTAMETALASRVFAHPTVQAIEKAQIEGWQDLGRVFVKAFDVRGQQYAIDFDDAWVWLAYGRKDNALRTLKAHFTEGADYITLHGTPLLQEGSVMQGSTPDKYYLTTNAFEDFAMAARTDAGKLVRAFFRAIRDAYVELTTQGQLALSQEQALTMAYHKKNVIYIGEVRAKGENIERLCKVGQTSDIAKRCDLHKQTFRSPFYFQLLPWLRWTTGSGLKVFSKNCPRYVRSSAGSTSASWARRSSSLCRTASPRRSWSYACVEQLVCDSRRPPVG
jgi:phage anti-repressor protein